MQNQDLTNIYNPYIEPSHDRYVYSNGVSIILVYIIITGRVYNVMTADSDTNDGTKVFILDY